MTSNTQEDYAKMMLGGGRSVEGNRSRSGKNTPSRFISAAGGKKSAKAKAKAEDKDKIKSQTQG